MDPTSTTFGFAIIFATFAGPIIAVFVTRKIDELRAAAERRLHIFRVLMTTRAIGINPDRVAALNMVQIEFHRYPAVLDAWKKLLLNFSRRAMNEDHARDIDAERRNLETKLLSQIAGVLNIKIDQIDILDNVYYPSGLVQLEDEQRMIRKFMVNVAEGRQEIPIKVNSIGNAPESPSDRLAKLF